MSQRFERKRRFTLTTIYSLIILGLVACSFTELEKFATENEVPEDNLAPQVYGKSGSPSAMLVPDHIIKGGKQAFTGVSGTFARYVVGSDNEITFIKPVAVGGVGDILYIVDAGARTVFRYDLLTKEIKPIGDVGIQFIGEPGNIYVAKDLSFYIVDSVGKQVLHFTADGLLNYTYKDALNLSRPMDVYVDELTKDVYVADGSFSHIVVFNEFGKSLRAIGGRGTGPGRFRAITYMTYGRDGLFVTDRLELPIQVLTLDGQFRYSFGESQQVFPTAIAINDDQLVFVSDKSDNTIRVYEHGELRSIVGGGGSAPGRFRLITGMWVKGQFLYVADSLNRRVQVLRINTQPQSSIVPLS
jgi:hypothetical protein